MKPVENATAGSLLQSERLSDFKMLLGVMDLSSWDDMQGVVVVQQLLVLKNLDQLDMLLLRPFLLCWTSCHV